MQSQLEMLQTFTLHGITYIPDKSDNSGSFLVNHCTFVKTNYMRLAADGKIHFISH